MKKLISSVLAVLLIFQWIPLDIRIKAGGGKSLKISLLKEAAAAGESWFTGYNYRKAITIDNTQNASALSDYQVKVTNPIYDETGLVGSWHFDGGTTGAIANATTAGLADTSGNSNNGTASNANGTGMAWTAGKADGAVSFDGDDDYIEIGTTLLDSPPANGTMEMWVKLNSFNSPSYRSTLYNKGTMGSNSQSVVGILDNGKISWWNGWNSGWGVFETNTGLIVTNNWYHIVLVWGSGGARIYVNGSAAATSSDTAAIYTTTENVMFGKRPTTTADKEALNGAIDEVKIYNRALSADEIKAQYEAKAKPNYGDVRFTKSDGTTELPYWMEKDGTFWVKASGANTIPASGTYTMYMYYGNSTPPASTLANSGANTFEFFDDFSGDLSKFVTGTGTAVITNGYVKLLDAATRTFTDSSTFTAGTDTELVFKAKAVSGGGIYSGFQGTQNLWRASQTNDAIWMPHSSTEAYTNTRKDGATEQTNRETTDTNWHTYTIRRVGTTSVDFKKDSGSWYSHTAQVPTVNLYVSLGADTNYEGDFDDIRVRKYASPEPTTNIYAEQEKLLFNYRKSISLSTPTPEANYQVKVVVDYNTGIDTDSVVNLDTNCKTDFSDIRFGDNSGNTYSYWRETYTASGTATFWVKVPNINTSTIYIYYGNSSAASASNGSATFEAFGGFTAWTETDPTSVLTVTSPRVTYTSVTANIAKTMVSTPLTYAGDFTIEWEELYSTTTDNYPPVVGVADNINGRWGYNVTEGVTSIVAWRDNTLTKVTKVTNGAHTHISSGGITVAANTLYYMRLQRSGSTVTLSMFTDSARTIPVGSPTSFTESTITTYNFIVAAANSGSNAGVGSGYQQNLKARKYAASEPAVTATGAQTGWSAKANVYSYRKPVTIDNTGVGNAAQYNYQVPVTLDTAALISAGKMNADGSDIRFSATDDYGEENWLVSYPYWIESGINTTSTKIWVKVDSLAAAATKTIYMYYGNPSASSASNGTNTFEFFDDFEDGTYTDKWTTVGTGTWTESEGKLRAQPSATSSYLRTTPDWSFSNRTNIAVEFNLYSTTWDGILLGLFDNLISGVPTLDTENAFYMAYNDQIYDTFFGGTDSTTGTPSVPAKIKYTYDGTTAKIYYDGVEKGSRAWTPPTVEFFGLGQFHTASSYNVNFAIDNLLVRKYAATEPSATLGSEEWNGILGDFFLLFE